MKSSCCLFSSRRRRSHLLAMSWIQRFEFWRQILPNMRPSLRVKKRGVQNSKKSGFLEKIAVPTESSSLPRFRKAKSDVVVHVRAVRHVSGPPFGAACPVARCCVPCSPAKAIFSIGTPTCITHLSRLAYFCVCTNRRGCCSADLVTYLPLDVKYTAGARLRFDKMNGSSHKLAWIWSAHVDRIEY